MTGRGTVHTCPLPHILYSENGMLLASLEDKMDEPDEYGKGETDASGSGANVAAPGNGSVDGNPNGTQPGGTLEQTGTESMGALGIATMAGAIAAGIGYLAVSRGGR